MERIQYSVCMCNYNMDATIEKSLRSILNQIDNRFEVIVVDDGSSDNSVKILNNLAIEYSSLRVIALKRDEKRKLGETRNVSIREARGEFILLHLDCDDIFGPFLIDFVKAFHEIEKAFGYPILLSGPHINMLRKSLMLEKGLYRNIYRGEDRNLWTRFAKTKQYIPFECVDFVTRIPPNRAKRFKKSLFDTWDHVVNDFRFGETYRNFLMHEKRKSASYSFKQKWFRLVISLPAFLFAHWEGIIDTSDAMSDFEEFLRYRESMRGTYTQLLERNNANVNTAIFSEKAKEIFFLEK